MLKSTISAYNYTIFDTASDHSHLSEKVILIFGISDAMRRGEWVNLLMSNITVGEDFMLMKISKTKNKSLKSFTIGDNLLKIYKKYLDARSVPCTVNRVFVNYKKGVMIRQPIGINKFGSLLKEVAESLELPELET
ncbi:hypothetical protein TKK_0014089 [Trichogramma kaykai]